MRTDLVTILLGILGTTTRAECYHPNGLIQTDAYHAPCSDVLNNPLNTMCCAIDRPNPPGGFSTNGFNADVCLPNGLCLQSWKGDENSTATIEYYREECTVKDWKSGKCLSVCLSNSVSKNVLMTPCDDTANSTKWCCGTNKDCCSGDVGVETLAQTFLGVVASSTLALSSATTSTSISTSVSNHSSSSATATANSHGSSSLSGGAKAGIIIAALAGAALIGAICFFIARRRRSASPPTQVDAGESHMADAPKFHDTYEADGAGAFVSEVSSANVKDHDGRAKVHEMQ